MKASRTAEVYRDVGGYQYSTMAANPILTVSEAAILRVS